YARIVLTNRHGATVLVSNVDMYSRYTTSILKFVTPILPKDTYTMNVTVVGENWFWYNKKKERSGSQGVAVAFDRVTVRN
ncbi:MAG TPA: hypothetical protein VJU59_45025, partial [Paraburkholderia sp.]|uniref:hypothetical protein n=1 Tax=Paraburkholderia sp. TaxID=1926495 RepID=UPI002B4777C3